MAARSEGFLIGEDGTVGRSGITSAGAVETNVAVWSPVLPTAFEKARDAAIFTRLGTPHSHKELKVAFEATPDVDQTFCLSVNNVILVFSASQDEHTMHCRTVLQMLQDRSMRADINDCLQFCKEHRCRNSVGASRRPQGLLGYKRGRSRALMCCSSQPATALGISC